MCVLIIFPGEACSDLQFVDSTPEADIGERLSTKQLVDGTWDLKFGV
jgi:hypothetical protein